MFEDNINADFFDDILETSFSTVGIKQHKNSEKNAELCRVQTKACNSQPSQSSEQNLKIHQYYTSNDLDQTDKYDQLCNRPIKRCKTEPLIDIGNSKKTKVDIFNSTTAGSPVVVKRELPGPAGLLPEMNVNNSYDQEIFLCSQKSFSIFEKGPWQEMVTDFQDSHQDLLFEKFNINWIKEHFGQKKQLSNYKAPFLACTIDSLERTDGKLPSIEIMLRDKVGTIQGTILHSLYEEFADFFTVGSVLVLIQISVLVEKGSLFLTITPNNLLTIYHINRASKENQHEDVKKIIVQRYTIDDIWGKYQRSLTSSHSSKRAVNLNNLYKNNNSSERNKFTVSNTNLNMPTMKMNTVGTTNLNNTKCILSPGENQNQILSIKNSSNTHEVVSKTKPSNSNAENVNLTISSSQISVKTDKAHSEIWKDLFQEVDTDALFDDF